VSLPEDPDFLPALHEDSVVGAPATARVNRASFVVLVGRQDRRHLPQEPFLAGRLEGLAGDCPVMGSHGDDRLLR
jgi:hypothetical protein